MLLTLTAPTIIAPTISLMLVAYNNKLGALSRLIRDLAKSEQDRLTQQQIEKIKQRIRYIQIMEFCGIVGLILSLISGVLLAFGQSFWGEKIFLGSVLFVLISLCFALVEIILSRNALETLIMCTHKKKK